MRASNSPRYLLTLVPLRSIPPMRVFMQIDPKELKRFEEEDRKSWEAEQVTEDSQKPD